MKLQYSGERKSDSETDTEFSGDVYQVLNADEFFSLNKGSDLCDKPIRWVTIRDSSDAIGEGTVRVGMLSIDDWHKYSPNSLGACSADSFKLK